MTWLEEVVQSRSELESPLSFWMWAGLSAISAVVKDNIWLDRDVIYKLYPNIYVMFHAESGLKKGPPVAMATRFVSSINNTRVITGRSSIQGILKEMGTARTKPGVKGVVGDASVFISSSELTSSIVDDKVAMDILTDLYDRQWRVGEWRSLLKMETFTLNNPTVTMLTATNEAHSSDFFSKKDIHGGYFARTFIVYESEENRINSLLRRLRNPPDDVKSITYLKELAKIKGAFKPLSQPEESDEYKIRIVDPDSGQVDYFNESGARYEEWYHNFRKDAKNQLAKDETGTLNRFGDSVLKVAMLLSLSERPELEITDSAMELAIRLCERLIGNVRQTTWGARGMSDFSPLKAKIIMELLQRENHMVSRPMLMKKLWMHYGHPSEFDEMMNSFDASGMIKTETSGNQIIYVMPDYQVDELTKFFSGKMIKGRN